MIVAICIVAVAMYAMVHGAYFGKQLLCTFLTVTGFILLCWLIGYFTEQPSYTTYRF